MATSKKTITMLRKMLDRLLPFDMVPLQIGRKLMGFVRGSVSSVKFEDITQPLSVGRRKVELRAHSPLPFSILRHTKLVSLLSFLFFWTGSGAENSDSLETLIKLIKSSKNHELICPEPFGGQTPYVFFRNVSHIQSATYPDISPDSEDYKKESEELPIFPPTQKSLEIHTSLENPAREKIILHPVVPKFFRQGIPVRISVWVYSNRYEGSLSLVFKHPGRGESRVEIGSLLFSGWKRFEKSFPYHSNPGGPRSPESLTHHFSSIEIQFKKTQPPGPVVIRLHRMGIVLEKYAEYPGSEIMDDWRFK